MFDKRDIKLFVATLILAGIVSCAPTMVGTNMGVYRAGKMYSVSDKDIGAVYDATLEAMKKLQLDVTSKAKDVFAAKVTAKSADNKDVIVEIKPLADNKTQYSIQVGMLGNEERSRKIFTEIKNNLMD